MMEEENVSVYRVFLKQSSLPSILIGTAIQLSVLALKLSTASNFIKALSASTWGQVTNFNNFLMLSC